MTTIILFDSHGEVTEPRSFSFHEKAGRFPGKRRWRGDVLQFQITRDNIEYAQKVWPDAQWDDKAGILEQLKQETYDPEKIEGTDVPYKFKSEPYKHQRDQFFSSRNKREFALLWDMGTGKTKELIDEASWLYISGKIDCVLVIAPNGVHRQWIEEQLPLHLPDHIKTVTHSWKTGKPTSKILNGEGMRWLAMNIEASITNAGKALAEQFLASGRCLMIVDESHKIKNPRAKRTKAIMALGRAAAARRIATGTPIAKGVEDYFSQFLFLNPNILGHKSFFTFRSRYCRMGGFQARQIIGYQNMNEFHSLIAPFSSRISKRDCLDLPAKIYQRRFVELTAEQQEHYRNVKRELFTVLDDGETIDTPLVIQKMMRLQQITCGFLPREDGSFQILDNNRPLVIDELTEEAPEEKMIIWCRFRYDVQMLAARYPGDCVVFDGSIGKEEARTAVNEWMNGPKRKFIATPGKGGTGLNLAGVSRINVYYSNSFSSLERWQSEDRTDRIGTKEAQLYIDILARGTIDIPIQANLKQKKDVSRMSMNELRTMLKVEAME